MSTLKEQAIELLEQNFNGSYIVPSHSQYPHMWLWDTCFHAIALLSHQPERAKNELGQLFAGQWESGLIPHIRFAESADKNYRPNNDDWGTDRPSSGITQPPVCATAVLKVYEATDDIKFLIDCYYNLSRYHRWLKELRDPTDCGLVAILHPWESGTDNSPIFTAARDHFLTTYPDIDVPPRVDRNNVSGDQRPTDGDYQFYWGLLKLLRDNSWDTSAAYEHCPFVMWDVLFNSIWCRANKDLALIASTIGEEAESKLWHDWHRQTCSAISAQLWDPADGFFYPFDLRKQQHVRIKTSSAFVSFFATTLSNSTGESLIKHLEDPDEFLSDHGLPSTAMNAEAFQPTCYWQGPVWLNIHWLVIQGLIENGLQSNADRLQRCSLQLVANEGFREYYDPRNGQGLGASNFSWSTLSVLS